MTAADVPLASPTKARAMREALVRKLEVLGDAVTPSVIEAMRLVPRHAFVPDAPLELAYANHALAIEHEQTISQPTVVAQMTEALELRGHERVLEVGTGSGYHAAVLSLLAREVFTVERIESLATAAARRLEELGYANVHVRTGDGYLGWPEEAPFDRIVITAAPDQIPEALFDQLAEGGILVAPVGAQDAAQWLVRVRRRGQDLAIERLGAVQFVEMVRGVER